MFAISPTDKDWFNYLKNSGLNSYVNFWTPTPWNIKQLQKGNRLYFMLKSPIRKIGGFGEFVEYKNLTAADAWIEFGFRNGRASRQEFINQIQKYIDKNSAKFGKRNINISTYKIGCVILNNCQFWESDKFITANNQNIYFASQIVKIKYLKQYDPFLQAQNDQNNFSLVNEPRNDRHVESNGREGQGEFKGKILRAYNNRCCISGETTPELLEAAHIQEYKNKKSNHVQNGLLLRVDLHRLYDNGLLFIDSNYKIHISKLILSQQYRQYHGQTIELPTSTNEHPSKDTLELRRNDFRD